MPDTQPSRETIKSWLNETGLTQSSVAEFLQIQQSWLSAILSGKDTTPKANFILTQIIQAYGIKSKNYR